MSRLPFLLHRLMTSAIELHALQEVDMAIDIRRARLAIIEEQLGEGEALLAAREEEASKEKALRLLKDRQKDVEWQVEEVRIKASGIEKKLYGGSIRNPKELQDLQADLSALQSHLRRREDELLASMVEVEEAEGDLKAAQKVLAEIEAAWKAGQEALLAENARLEQELAGLEEKHSRQVSNYDAVALGLYDRLRRRKDGRAVAKVERGMCSGCRITLPMSILQKARAGLELVQCVSCERILYVS